MTDSYLTPKKVGFINCLYTIIKEENPHLRIELTLYEDECKRKNIEIHVTDGLKHIQRFIDEDSINMSGMYTFAKRLAEDMKIKEYFGGNADD